MVVELGKCAVGECRLPLETMGVREGEEEGEKGEKGREDY